MGGGIVYMRDHVTPQDRVYLREGAGCGDGKSALLSPSHNDFINKACKTDCVHGVEAILASCRQELGLFELRGTRHACVNSSSVHYAPQQCLVGLCWEHSSAQGVLLFMLF